MNNCDGPVYRVSGFYSMKRGCDDDGNRDMVVVEAGIFFDR